MTLIHSLMFGFVTFYDQNKTKFNSTHSLLNSLVSDTHLVKVDPYTKVFEVFSIYYFFILRFFMLGSGNMPSQLSLQFQFLFSALEMFLWGLTLCNA